MTRALVDEGHCLGTLTLLRSAGKFLEASSEAPSARGGADPMSGAGVSLRDGPGGTRGTALGAAEPGVIAGSLRNAVVKLTTYQ